MSTRIRRGFGPFFLLSALALAGCSNSSGPEKLVPASGRVLRGTTPLANVPLQLTPVDPAKGWTANATANADGHFTLQTNVPGKRIEPGAAPGEYKVTFNVYPSDTRVPEKYQSVDKSDLTVIIPPDGTDKLVINVP